MTSYLKPPEQKPVKPYYVQWVEFCERQDPSPLQCELPDDLKLQTISSSATVMTYSYNAYASLPSGYGTLTKRTY